MHDQHLKMLVDIQKELSTNTESTKGMHNQLIVLNGKVATHSKEIGKIRIALIIVGSVVATLLITNGSEFVSFIKLLM